MSIDPSQDRQSVPPTANFNKEKQILDEGMGRLFQTQGSGVRQSKLMGNGNQTKEIIRSARSGSIKQKLNLENTRLKINIDNLNSLLSVHQNNESRYRQELDRFRQKILRYKEKIKQKDTIIAKLLEKLQKKIEVDGRSLQNLILKLHEQHLKGFKSRLLRGEQLDVNDVLGKYQELLKGFTKGEKDRLYLEKEKEELERTVRELRDTIQFVGDGKGDPSGEVEKVKAKLRDAESLLEKQKVARNGLLEIIQNSNLQLKPQLRTTIAQLQKQRSSLSSVSQPRISVPAQQMSQLRQKLAQSESNLFRERQSRRSTEKHCSMIEEHLQRVSKELKTSHSSLQSLKSRVEKIQDLYRKEMQQLQQKTKLLLQDSTNIDQYRKHIEQNSTKFAETIKKFSEESSKWAALENDYQRRLDTFRGEKRSLEDRLEREVQKRKIFELKLMGEDGRDGGRTVQQLRPEDMGVYLDQRVEGIQRESERVRKENQVLAYQLDRSGKAYDVLDRELKDAESRIFKLEQLLKRNRIPLQQTQQAPSQQIPSTAQSQSPADPTHLPFQPQPQSQQPQTQQPQLATLSTPQLHSRIKQLESHNAYLEEHLNQFRNRCVDLQVRLEEKGREIEKLVDRARKEGERLASNQATPKSAPPLEMILSQPENQPEQGNSQQIDQMTYKNINQQMDRLILKNSQLSNQLSQAKHHHQQQLTTLNTLNSELKQKLKSSEQINTNLSNIVVHLEAELSRYQNNLDNSREEMRGSQVGVGVGMEASGRSGLGEGVEERKIGEKRKQFQEMLKSGSSVNQRQSREYQQQLKSLEMEIRALQQQKQGKKDKPATSQQDLNLNLNLNPNQPQSPVNKPAADCQNCQNLTKLSSELIQKLSKLQQQKHQKTESYKKQLQVLQPVPSPTASSFPTSSPSLTTHQQLQKQNANLRRLIAQLKTQFLYQSKEQEEYQNQIKNLREINQELVGSIHEKEKLMLKLRTDLYRQNYQGIGAIDQGSLRKIDGIFQAYESKIDQLEGILKGQEKNQVNISDLYDTINYLNNECERLRKEAQQAPQPSPPLDPSPQLQPPQIPPSHSQLAQKYLQLHSQLSSLHQLAQSHSHPTITSFLKQAQQQKSTNLDLMRENNRLQNKLMSIQGQYEDYFRKIGQGEVYQAIRDREREIEELREQVARLTEERERMFLENQKIGRDLKCIQQNIQKITGGKISMSSLESTLIGDRTSGTKALQKTTLPQISQSQIQPATQQPLGRLPQKLLTLKSLILASPHKSRPNFPTLSLPQLPTLQQILIILLDRLHYAWNLIQDRTTQYNELRDQMNIISMECMKNNGVYDLDGKMGYSGDGSRRDVEVIQERYQEVLAELVQYENQNKRLEREVNRLKMQISQYKRQVQQVQQKYLSELKSQSSEDVLPYNKQALNKLLDSHSSVISTPVQNPMPEIIKMFLARIKELEGNLQAIQVEFDEKNRKLESLILKEKSFMSEKSRQRELDQSSGSAIKKQPLSDRQKPQVQPKPAITPLNPLTTPTPAPQPTPHPQQKSYSLNSARVFKQIEQLTRMNEELRDKKYKYRGILENVTKVLEVLLARYKGQLEERLRVEMEGILGAVNEDFQEEGKKDNSGFDLEGDYILSASFGQKAKGSAKNINRDGLEQVHDSLRGSRVEQPPKAKKAEQSNKRLQEGLRFLNQNKFLLEQLISKVNQIKKIPDTLESIQTKLANTLTDKELQQLLYIADPEQSIPKLLQILQAPAPAPTLTSTKKVTFEGDRNQQEGSYEEGQWVETEQLQAIINRIYPHKSQLCLLVANSINMLMMAETKEGILRAVEYLFSSLKKKQNQIREQMKKRDESVTEYGRKLQKLLQSKYSQDESMERSDLLNENSFRKTSEFKSEYQIKKEEEKDRSNLSQSNSQSQSYSGFINQKSK